MVGRTPATKAAQIEDSVTGHTAEPTTIAGYLLAVARAVEARGRDSRPVFAAAELHAPPPIGPLHRVTTIVTRRVLEVAVRVTGDPLIGLDVALCMSAGTLHALGLSLQVSDDLRDFGQRLARYYRFLSSDAEITFAEADDRVALEGRVAVETPFESEDAMVGFLANFVRRLSGARCQPCRIRLRRPLPYDDGRRHREFFGCPVDFAQPLLAIEYERSALDVVFEGASRELAQHNDLIVIDYLARLDRSDIHARVKWLILQDLSSGSVSKSRIAAKLNMSPRTLQHKLAVRHTSFNNMVNELRREIACAYLENGGMPVTEIAYRLGFSDTSNFGRAFRRWTGQSPSDYRETGRA